MLFPVCKNTLNYQVILSALFKTVDTGDVTDGGGQGAVTSPGEPGHKIRSRTRKRHILANKPQDFQIRVRVIEGRQLPGNNIKPVVKVHVCGETHRTRIRKGNNPYFDEVYNSNSFRADFELITKNCFFIPAHCIMKKWILLNDPDDSSSGAKGYLKVSMFVLGTGDEPPVERKEQDNDKDDVESNLLLPAGVALRWVTLKLKVFRAEDVPQMDDSITQTLKEAFGGQENKKNLVDPYVEAWFAGKKLCTQIIEKNANPEWNQQLNLKVKFPSMCERIKLTVFDCSALGCFNKPYSNIYPATIMSLETFLLIVCFTGETGNSEIGFLPTFGPCYINLYGSPREFSALSDPYEDLNLGKGEGAAYRGRILVELSTKLDGKADKSVEEIPSDDILVVQKYQRRRKYCLCAVFHSATMIQEPGEPIQFEVSIGNYGNKMDLTCKPLASTTQYSCAVFDGNNYYYLPWADTKPVIAITSFWEDISHRLDSLNTILYISNRLVSEYARLVEICFRIPDMEGKPNLTALDIQQKMLRDSALENIMKGAKHLFEEATDVNKCLSVIEGWLDKLKQLAEEPQNSMPDVIIWMLRGEKRVAYTRIPAHQVLYSSYKELILNHCLSQYENQAQVLGKWGTTGLLNRSKFSDVTGKVKLKQEYFLPPVGWEWEGDWRVDPEKTLLTEADAGHTEFVDEVYENETRLPGGEWKLAAEPYTDVNGEKVQGPAEIECPPGWKWEDIWTFDGNRAVDEKGWEYGVTIPPDDKPKSWVAAEKMYHVHRRKRMIRPRKRIPGAKTAEANAEGWEYSSLIGWKFHRKQRSSDTFRRRRWRRKMTPADRVGASAIFKLEGALGDEKGTKAETSVKQFGANTPTVSCTFDQSNTYHLRVYVYQARNLTALDKDSFSDPYVHVSFLHHSQTTETIRSTLNPTWDQTLIFKNVEIYGDPQSLAQNPPIVVMEIFDSDQVGKDEMLGRSTCVPIVKLTSGMDASPKLLWEPVTHKNGPAGEILVAAELILKTKGNDTELPLIPPKRGEKLYMVPQGVRPVVQLTAIEVLAWGLRNMKTYQLAPVTSPSLVVECGGERAQTAVIKNMKKCPNFAGNVLLLKVLLPKEEMYTPPIVLKVIDHRPFGRKPVVGQCTINFLEEFRCDPYATGAEVAMSSKGTFPFTKLFTDFFFLNLALMAASPRDLHEKETVDWWSKFYASVGESERCRPYLDKGYDTLEVYDHELESAKEFMGLTDFCSTFKLQCGKNESDDDDPAVVGEFKGSFKVYPLPDDPGVPPPPQQFRELPDSVSQECVVRIYVVQAIDLQPKDNNGKCDPYIKISLGKKSIDDRDNYVPYTLNPVFGRMFELTCFLPQDKDLKIAIYDFDLLSRDEKVGETVIDLENRLLSRFGSYCGLAQTYCISGPNHWRDQLNPSKILEQLARWKGLSPPRSEDNGNTLSFGGRLYYLQPEIHEHLGPPSERIALHVLRTQGLVLEHVETRTLYSSFQPTLPQGKLQMWVDIFPKSLGPPGPPFDISPRKAKKYFLRVIVWNTTDVVLDETSITGENMSDIYVKGWMPGMEEDKQKTDVHYRSLDGDGNFSWRFVFGFEYLPAEQLCLVSKKEHFWSLDKSEFRIPPKLIVQIWDNDKFSLDDYLGAIELDLHHVINPSKTPEKCSLSMVPDGTTPPKSDQLKSLFDQKAVRGWWPCYMDKDGKRELGGKVELTLEIVNEKEADERPAGKGRDEPNMNPKLDPPKRPDTSFFWFTNPCKTCRFIVWRRFKWLFIGLVVLILVLLFIGILLYSLPNYISMKIVKPFN
uniref:Myoferlin-like n=1 Tax=Sinocyclocheilus anshuiensis TaxID=1608454 RepID=A0A671NYB4_9TELE